MTVAEKQEYLNSEKFRESIEDELKQLDRTYYIVSIAAEYDEEYRSHIIRVYLQDKFFSGVSSGYIIEVIVPIWKSSSQHIVFYDEADADWELTEANNAKYVISFFPSTPTSGTKITNTTISQIDSKPNRRYVDCLGQVFEYVTRYDLDVEDAQTTAGKETNSTPKHTPCTDCKFLLRQYDWWENTRIVTASQLKTYYRAVTA